MQRSNGTLQPMPMASYSRKCREMRVCADVEQELIVPEKYPNGALGERRFKQPSDFAHCTNEKSHKRSSDGQHSSDFIG